MNTKDIPRYIKQALRGGWNMHLQSTLSLHIIYLLKIWLKNLHYTNSTSFSLLYSTPITPLHVGRQKQIHKSGNWIRKAIRQPTSHSWKVPIQDTSNNFWLRRQSLCSQVLKEDSNAKQNTHDPVSTMYYNKYSTYVGQGLNYGPTLRLPIQLFTLIFQ
jgi:hypothetical protein